MPDVIETVMAKSSCNDHTVFVELTSIDVKSGLVDISVFTGVEYGNQVDFYVRCLEDTRCVQTPMFTELIVVRACGTDFEFIAGGLLYL